MTDSMRSNTAKKAQSVVEYINIHSEQKYHAYHTGRKVFVEDASLEELWTLTGQAEALFNDWGERIR